MKSYGKLIGYTCLVSIVVLSLGTVAVACTADGEIDPTFGVGGKVISDFSGEACAVALQADDKIVVLGNSGDRVTGYYPVLVRYQADGTPDATFGTAGTGKLIIADEKIFVNGTRRRALTVQTDGKIVVAANTAMIPSPMPTGGAVAEGMPPLHDFLDIVVLRYLPDGTPDVAFGQDGRVTTDLSDNSDDYAISIVLQPDKKIVVAGFIDTSDNRNFAVLRYHPDGTVDRSFGSDGVVITDVGSRYDEGCAVVVQPDGKILVAGFTYQRITQYDFAVVRYTSEGMLDPTFGPTGTGIVTTDIAGYDQGNAMLLQPDGKIVVAGFSGNHDFVVVRYNQDGTLDTTFGVLGKVITDFGDNAQGVGRDIVLQPDGKLIVMGYLLLSNTTANIAVARYNPDGSPDVTFGLDGKVTTNLTGKAVMAYAATLQFAQKIVVVGSVYVGTEVYFAIVRYCGQCSMSHIGK